MNAWIGARNEAIIRAGGQEYRLLFTNRALGEAERTAGVSILALISGFTDADNTSGINELAHLMRAGLEAARRDAREGGRPFTLNQAFDILDKAGFTPVLMVVLEAVSNVLGYDGAEDSEDDDPNA